MAYRDGVVISLEDHAECLRLAVVAREAYDAQRALVASLKDRSFEELNDPLFSEMLCRTIEELPDHVEAMLECVAASQIVPFVSISSRDLMFYGNANCPRECPLEWELARAMGIYYGCGNSHQAQIQLDFTYSAFKSGIYDLTVRPFTWMEDPLDLMDARNDGLSAIYQGQDKLPFVRQASNRLLMKAARNEKANYLLDKAIARL